jgi:CRP-like cAMP-binding protein
LTNALLVECMHVSMHVRVYIAECCVGSNSLMHTRLQALEALRTFTSPLALALEDAELANLAKTIRLFSVSPNTPLAPLYKQDQGAHAGWGPFGTSAFLLIDGEISVRVRSEDSEGAAEREVLRMTERGESVGEFTLCTGTARTHSAYACGGSTVGLISQENWESAVQRRGQVVAELENIAQQFKHGGAKVMIEPKVVSVKVTHSLKLRRSNLLKMLTDSELEYIASAANVREESKESVLVRQGEEGNSILVVVRGTLQVLMAFAQGDEPREVCGCRVVNRFAFVCLCMYMYVCYASCCPINMANM